jgi:hypothetical protein
VNIVQQKELAQLKLRIELLYPQPKVLSVSGERSIKEATGLPQKGLHVLANETGATRP